MVHELIQITHNDDASAKITVSLGSEDYRFTVSAQDDRAVIEYEETHDSRYGLIRVSEPGPDVFKTLAQSDEMTEFLDTHDLDGVSQYQ